jgi:hypothetical protein
MALQSLKGVITVPTVFGRSGGVAFTSVLLDAAAEALAVIFQAPLTGTIDRIGFRTGTVTTGATVTCTIEGVSVTTGDPDGVAAGSGTVAIADTDDNVWKEATLSSTAAVTRGNVYAAVITVPAGANLNVVYAGTAIDNIAGLNLPYSDEFLAGVWSKSNNAAVINIRYDSGVYEPIGTLPASGIAITTFNSGSTPDERGLFFQLPFPATLTGAIVNGLFTGGSTIKVYDSDGTTVLTSLVVDPDQAGSANAGPYRFLFPATVALAKTTNYRISVLPSSASNNTLTDFTVNTAAMMDAFDGGQAFHLTTRTDAGAWTQTTTQRPFIYLLLSAFDDAAQDGGFFSLLTLLGVGR